MKLISRLRAIPSATRWGAALFAIIVVAGWLVPLCSPYGVTTNTGDALAPPSASYLFGTDNLGRDVFTRTFAAAQLDLGIALVGVAIPLVVGTLVGALAGTTALRFVRGFVKLIIDGVNAIPFIVLALAVIAIVGTGVGAVLLAIGVSTWARYATLARTRASVIRDVDFVSAMRVLGYRRGRILVRHVLPNVFRESVAYGVSDFTIVILTVASLSFLGAGIQPPTPEWGSMIADGRLYLLSSPWVLVGPGLVLTLTGFAASLIGEGMGRRDV
jgi:peptide/nickel transport system permease protein